MVIHESNIALGRKAQRALRAWTLAVLVPWGLLMGFSGCRASGAELAGLSGPPTVRGPIPTRILQPASLIFPSPRPRRGALLERGEARVAAEVFYSSIFERKVAGFDAADFDGEIARGSLMLSYGATDDLEVVIEPSVLFAHSGFLDRIVDEFHAFSGFSGGGRESYPRNRYSMRLERNGVTAYELREEEALFGDLPISFVSRVRDEDADGPALAARLTVELPTGNEADGSGSGGIDVAAGVSMERSLGRWTFFGGADGMLVDQPERFQDAGIDVRSVFFANGGLEYRWNRHVSLLGQAVLQMPLTRDLTFEEIDREILDLGFGLAFDVSKDGVLTLTFHEDAVAASGPDVTVYAGLVFRF